MLFSFVFGVCCLVLMCSVMVGGCRCWCRGSCCLSLFVFAFVACMLLVVAFDWCCLLSFCYFRSRVSSFVVGGGVVMLFLVVVCCCWCCCC